MVKKIGKKRRHKHTHASRDIGLLCPDLFGFPNDTEFDIEQEKRFRKHVRALQALFGRYRRMDVATALNVSDLWLPNTASSIKHIFAWCVLLGLERDTKPGRPIASYSDFKQFAEKLYATWPTLPTLEDFSPEADLGHIKVRLGKEFVPIFYGSCIERTPDFVEAFRITFAHIPAALAQMDLVIALQKHVIEALSDFRMTPVPELQEGYIEVPTENFWNTCKTILPQLGSELAAWLENTDETLQVSFRDIILPKTWSIFSGALKHGTALPFLAINRDNSWLPISIRSAPSVVINHWAGKGSGEASVDAHRALAQFVAERFPGTLRGPFKLFIDGRACKDVAISCVILFKSSLYFICASDRPSYQQVSKVAKSVSYGPSRNEKYCLYSIDDNVLQLNAGATGRFCAKDIHFVVVKTQAGTAPELIVMPEDPVRFLPLADFITIFDSLNDISEINYYWEFVDTHRHSLASSSTGPADLFAAFRDMNGLIVEGATDAHTIHLYPHWGTSWRFKILADFWARAPKVFPDGSSGWHISEEAVGLVSLKSRNRPAVALSTEVGDCTVQLLIEIEESLRFQDFQMLDLFAQIIVDYICHCRELLLECRVFQQSYILLICYPNFSDLLMDDDGPLCIDEFARVITSIEEVALRPNAFHLKVNTRAVFAGLSMAEDARFEVRCLLETLELCHAAYGLELSQDLIEQFVQKFSGRMPRYAVRVDIPRVDIPELVEPIVPWDYHYKFARKQVALEIMSFGASPGRYKPPQAKTIVDHVSKCLRLRIEERLRLYQKSQLLKAFIEQYDALLSTERREVQRVQHSLVHEVDYDRVEEIGRVSKESGTTARHYRYLLEKTVSLSLSGEKHVSAEALRELVGLVDWYMVLTGFSDSLHNHIETGELEIDHSYIPQLSYSPGFENRQRMYAQQDAEMKLGVGVNPDDAVKGESKQLLSSEKLRNAFMIDLGFELQNMLAALDILSRPYQLGFADKPALSYSAQPDRVAQELTNNIDNLQLEEARKIIDFLTLSEMDICKLSGRDSIEVEVPYWEHRKRTHRYAIRPLIRDGTELRWGAELVSRVRGIWMSTVRDGYLPADFEWRHVEAVINDVKRCIENKLECRTKQIFSRHTSYVQQSIDFFRKFRGMNFEDVGDFDVFAYWPDLNLLVTAECKYNLPPYTAKESARLRRKIFGKEEADRDGQFSRLLRRRQFIELNRGKLLDLLKWPQSAMPPQYKELYVSREIHYWMVNSPYSVPTEFVRVDSLDNWITTNVSLRHCSL